MARTNLIFVSLSFLLLYFVFCSAFTNITRDQFALVELKANVIDSYHFLDNWSTNISVCKWTGVTCSSRHDRVTAVNISNMALAGTIPPEFGNLSFLAFLDMSGNNLHGNLPEELVHLRRLRLINFSVNNFTGQLPSWFGSLPKLQHLILSNNSFTGPIPPSTANFTSLRTMRLKYNFLQGQIPQKIGNLGKLVHLDFEENQLTGPIPYTIFNISSLETIALTYNDLTGNVPVDLCRHLPRLKGLHLSKNKFYGQIPSSLYNCVQLQVLALAYNNFSGSLSKDIGNLTMLKNLALGGNQFTGFLPEEIGNLHQLKKFGCENNSLQGSIPAGLFNLSNLQFLSLQVNHFSANLPSSMGYKLSNLGILALDRNNLSGVIPESISNCSKLRIIDLSVNKFTGSVPSSLDQLRLLEGLYLFDNNLGESTYGELRFITSLTNCRHLKELWVGDNPLNGYLPHSIGNLSTSLESIKAGYCKISRTIPDEIGNLSSLVILSLHGNNLSGSTPSTVKGLQQLQGLFLHENRIKGSIPHDVCKLPYLGALYLSQNQITGDIPVCLGNITSLRYLHLADNMLVSAVPTSLWYLNDLLLLSLSVNSLNGFLPPETANLKAVTFMDLSRNFLSGDVPTSIGGLQSLEELDLSHNKFQGSIPESLGNMLSLAELNLSHNNLSGAIPKSLENLLHLKYFNVSFNKLTGEIPNGGPFANLNGTSFISNEALCGNSQFSVSPCPTSTSQNSKRKRVLRMIFIILGVALAIVGLATAILLVKYARRKKVPTRIAIWSPPMPGRISYYELLQATEGYNESNLLGVGSFGSVYKGILQDGTVLAVKVFNLQVEGAYKSFDAECDILCNIRHRNLTKVITSCSNNDFKALVLEYMQNGSLEKWLYSENCFLYIIERLNIMIDVACALDYLHSGCSTPIVHCDLKPSNVLLDENMTARVSDFGIAKFLNEGNSFSHTSTLATIGYIAPEFGSGGLVSPFCDIYSYGIMLMETFTRTKPSDEKFTQNLNMKQWIHNSLLDDLNQVIDADLLRPGEEHFTQKLQSLLSIMELALSCCAESPKERMKMEDVLATLRRIKVQILAYC